KQQVSLEVFYIGDHNGNIREEFVVPIQQKFDDDVLVNRRRIQAVSSGKIENIRLDVMRKLAESHLLFDGDSGVVPYLLLESGKGIKHRSCSDVRIPYKCNVDILVAHHYCLSTVMCLAVSMRMAKYDPFTSRYSGSPNGATCSSCTSFPGRHPISSNFNGMDSISKSEITARSPIFR